MSLASLRFAVVVAALLAVDRAQAEDCDPPFRSVEDFTRCTETGTLALSDRDPLKAPGRLVLRPLPHGDAIIADRDTFWLSMNGASAGDGGGTDPSFVAVYLVGIHAEELREADRNLSVYRNRGWSRQAISARPLSFNARGLSKDYENKDLDRFGILHNQDDPEEVADFLERHQLHGRPASHLAGSWDNRAFFARKVSELPECRSARVCDVRVRLLRFTPGPTTLVPFWINTDGLAGLYVFTKSPLSELFEHRVKLAFR